MSAPPTIMGRGPSEAEHQRETLIANHVVDLPTEPRPVLQFRRAKGGE
jgi:hypothetical protein